MFNFSSSEAQLQRLISFSLVGLPQVQFAEAHAKHKSGGEILLAPLHACFVPFLCLLEDVLQLKFPKLMHIYQLMPHDEPFNHRSLFARVNKFHIRAAIEELSVKRRQMTEVVRT